MLLTPLNLVELTSTRSKVIKQKAAIPNMTQCRGEAGRKAARFALRVPRRPASPLLILSKFGIAEQKSTTLARPCLSAIIIATIENWPGNITWSEQYPKTLTGLATGGLFYCITTLPLLTIAKTEKNAPLQKAHHNKKSTVKNCAFLNGWSGSDGT